MERKDQIFVRDATIKALSQIVPLFGGIFSSIYGDVATDREMARVNEMLESLRHDLEDRFVRVNNSFISKDDFIDLFKLTRDKIKQERSEVKRVGFKNILLTGMTSQEGSYDEVERHIKILDQLTQDHVYLLKIFLDPVRFVTEKGNIDPNFRTSTLRGLFTNVFTEWDYDYLTDLLGDLENLRLISPILQDWQTMILNRNFTSISTYLTPRGKKFLSYVAQ